MFNYFIFNKKHSIDDFGMYFESIPVLPSVTNDVPQIYCTCGFKTNKLKLLNIKKWLLKQVGQLKFSFDDRIFTVTNIVVEELKKNKTFTVVSILFTVNDMYLLPGTKLEIHNHFDSIKLYNRGFYETQPKISIEGGGNIIIRVNGVDSCTIENVNGVVTIDSEIQECYVGLEESITALKNRDFYGEFPIFQEETNEISITSTTNQITKVIIEPRWAI